MGRRSTSAATSRRGRAIPGGVGAIALVALVALIAVPGAPGASADSGLLLYGTEGNRLRRYDVDTIGTARLVEEILIERASAGEFGSAAGGPGRDVNGNLCPIPDGSGRFLLGEDTGQPTPPAGWGVFEADGTQVGKLTATYQVANAEPFGCAFDPNTAALYTTSVGAQGFGTASGQLIKWFPPYDRFPGPPGAYPDTHAASDGFCKIAIDIGTASEVLVLDGGDILVAAAGGLEVTRFRLPPGKSLDPNDPAGGCTATDPQGSPLVDASVTGAPDFRTTLVAADNEMISFSGLAPAPGGHFYAASVLTGRIAEYRPDGTRVRFVLDPPDPPLGPDFRLPISTGNPQGLAVAPDGSLYYADLDLQGTLPNVGPGPDGKVRRIRFDAATGAPQPPEIVRRNLSFPDGVEIFPGDLQQGEWRTLAGGPDRLFHQPDETILDTGNVAGLVERWHVPTGAVVTGSPTVAQVDVPGQGLTRVVYFLSWDLHLYAVRLVDGGVLWKVATEDQPGASFPATASIHVERVGDRDRVFVGQGEIFYAFDAATGQEIWRFTAGTGCRDAGGAPPGLCGFDGERNQIESTAIVADGKVFFGMDVNDVATGKGGFAALDASTGALAWWFDLESGQTCRPLPGDDVRAYDGYHSEAELGLPAGFFASRPGCDHPRTPNGCGNVWSSPAWDPARGQLFVASSNCDTPIDPGTGLPAEMPPFDEAIFSLTTDGDVAWVWRPRFSSNQDLAFGGVPNLFDITVDVGGVPTVVDVVGVGNKDGTYYVLDRDGRNLANGAGWDDDPASHLPADLPYWSTNVVAGGDIGGILSTAAVDVAARRVTFCTAPGDSVANAPPGPSQTPTTHSLDLDTGAVLWQSSTLACFSSVSAFADVAIVGTGVGARLRFVDVNTGADVSVYDLSNAGQGSAAVVLDGTVLVGAGIGTRSSTGSGPGDFVANIPSNLTALCVPGTAGCAACNDGLDNDGDGRVDAPADDGCVDPSDASEVLGDLDYDGDVDDGDRHRFFQAFGRAPGEVGYARAADLEPPGAPDGAVDLVDFQRWVAAEEAYRNPPPPPPVAAGSPVPPPPPSCGLIGLEALLVPLLAAARRRLRASRPARRARRGARILGGLACLALGLCTGDAARAAVTLQLVPDRAPIGGEVRLDVGETLTVDVVADLDQPILGFGLDATFDAALLSLGAPTIGAGFAGVNAPDGDGLAGLATGAAVTGSGLVIARLPLSALAPGLTALGLGATVGDLFEGFALVPAQQFDTVDFGPPLAIRVVPEPGTAVLMGLGLAALARARRPGRGRGR